MALKRQQRPAFLISMLLEELLHVQLFAWRSTTQQTPDLGSMPTMRQGTRIIAERVVDEYWAARRKSEISGTNPIFDDPDNPGKRTSAFLSYGSDVVPILQSAASELELLDRFSLEDNVVESEIHDLVAITHRLVFDPLARRAGFLASSGVLDPFPPPSESAFFETVVLPYWDYCSDAIDQAYEKGFDGIPSAVETVENTIEKFWNRIGFMGTVPT